MKEEEIEFGDLVQLKSGGPIMTLGGLKSDSNFNCYWFDKEENFHTQAIYIKSLKKAKVESK